jgi:hypothetical protein
MSPIPPTNKGFNGFRCLPNQLDLFTVDGHPCGSVLTRRQIEALPDAVSRHEPIIERIDGTK